MFFASLQWVTLIFSWFYWKQRFRLFSAKLRCFQHYVCENSLSFFSYLNCAFNPLSHRKHVLRFFATKLEAYWNLISQKTVICLFVAKYAALNFIAPTICFSLLKTKLGLLKLYIAKKGIVAFLLVKHIAINFVAQKPSFGLFAVKLCCCQRYWTCRRFSSSFQRVPSFNFILLKTCLLLPFG